VKTENCWSKLVSGHSRDIHLFKYTAKDKVAGECNKDITDR